MAPQRVAAGVLRRLRDKAFGNWRAKFKAEPQPLARKVLYRRGGLSHAWSCDDIRKRGPWRDLHRTPLQSSVYCDWIACFNLGILAMTGPRPAGRPWTLTEEAQLRVLFAAGVKVGLIARKLKRSPGAVYARISSFKKMPSDLTCGAKPHSLPSERLANAHTAAKRGDIKDCT